MKAEAKRQHDPATHEPYSKDLWSVRHFTVAQIVEYGLARHWLAVTNDDFALFFGQFKLPMIKNTIIRAKAVDTWRKFYCVLSRASDRDINTVKQMSDDEANALMKTLVRSRKLSELEAQ